MAEPPYAKAVGERPNDVALLRQAMRQMEQRIVTLEGMLKGVALQRVVDARVRGSGEVLAAVDERMGHHAKRLARAERDMTLALAVLMKQFPALRGAINAALAAKEK